MRDRRQDYLSSIFKYVGLAIYAPFGSLIFQWVVFKKDIFTGYIYFSVVLLLLGTIFLGIGYIIIQERRG